MRGAELMAKSCKGLAMELVKFLSETDCVKVQKRLYKECAGEKVPNITSECVGLRETYFNCKRGQCDRPLVCKAGEQRIQLGGVGFLS